MLWIHLEVHSHCIPDWWRWITAAVSAKVNLISLPSKSRLSDANLPRKSTLGHTTSFDCTIWVTHMCGILWCNQFFLETCPLGVQTNYCFEGTTSNLLIPTQRRCALLGNFLSNNNLFQVVLKATSSFNTSMKDVCASRQIPDWCDGSMCF